MSESHHQESVAFVCEERKRRLPREKGNFCASQLKVPATTPSCPPPSHAQKGAHARSWRCCVRACSRSCVRVCERVCLLWAMKNIKQARTHCLLSYVTSTAVRAHFVVGSHWLLVARLFCCDDAKDHPR